MKIRLLRNWMGHLKGAEIEVTPVEAGLLINRGSAEPIETKAVNAPPENKAIQHAPENKTRHSRKRS